MTTVNFLAAAVFFISLILIANAAEDNVGESYNMTNETFFNNSNSTETNNAYGLNNAGVAFINESINESVETSDPLNASQNSLNSTNETETINGINYLNETTEADYGAGDTLTAENLTTENANIGAEENLSNTDEIAAEPLQAQTDYASGDAAESEENEESSTALTAGFGVYLEIVG